MTEWRIEKWRALIVSHLPRGAAISRNPDSNWMKWVRAIAILLAELDEKLEAVAKEWNPLYTITRLHDWVITTTAKNDCGAVTDTQEEQRARVLARLRMTAGGMDGKNGSAAAFAYLEAVAERLGYNVTITKAARCVINVTINSYNGGVACSPRRYNNAPYGGLYGDCGYALLDCILHKYVRASWQINFIWPT